MRRRNVRNQRLVTHVGVSGNLTGLVVPIKKTLGTFGKVRKFTVKNVPNSVVFVVTHDGDPLKLIESILPFKLKGVQDVALISSTTMLGV